MSDDTISLSFSVPLDDDGFLRRECPECEREFKWRYSEDDSEPTPDEGYFCPYCGKRSDVNSWFTQVQLDMATSVAAREVVDPMMEDFTASMKRAGLSASYEHSSRLTDMPDEPNDMRRVDFTCHSREPVKVLEGWTEPVNCLICGSSTAKD